MGSKYKPCPKCGGSMSWYAEACAKCKKWPRGTPGDRAKRSAEVARLTIPLSKGGPHTAANLSVAHRSCNSRRHAGRLPAQLRLIG